MPHERCIWELDVWTDAVALIPDAQVGFVGGMILQSEDVVLRLPLET